jgi:hypothetical protein
MFLVTFHGVNDDPTIPGVEQVYLYGDDGSGGQPCMSNLIPPGPKGFRDIQFLKETVYLVNSYKAGSAIYQISGNSPSPPFVSGVGSPPPVLPSVYHPFSISFAGADDALDVCYIANQDSNVVVRVGGPDSATPGQAMPISSWLLQTFPGATFLPGTFVASQVPLSPPGFSQVPTAVHDNQGGLAASPSDLAPNETPSKSVRAVAAANFLYVADEVGDCIRKYDLDTGEYIENLADGGLVQAPTHLLVAPSGMLYISVTPKKKKNNYALVLAYNFAGGGAISTVISQETAPQIENPAGMTFDGDGNFYLAERKGKAVYKFNSDFNLADNNPFIADMPDNPEFILWISNDRLSIEADR